MGSRRQSREHALQALYQCDALNDWSNSSIELYFQSFHSEIDDSSDDDIKPSDNTFTRILISGVIQNLEAIDSCISNCCQNWSINRMARVDRNIIRIATFELAFMPDVPPNVSINEAIEVAKRYSADDSPMFVNGVLDKIAGVIKEHGAIPAHFIRRAVNS